MIGGVPVKFPSTNNSSTFFTSTTHLLRGLGIRRPVLGRFTLLNSHRGEPLNLAKSVDVESVFTKHGFVQDPKGVGGCVGGRVGQEHVANSTKGMSSDGSRIDVDGYVPLALSLFVIPRHLHITVGSILSCIARQWRSGLGERRSETVE